MGKSITNNALPSEEGTTADAVLHLKRKKKFWEMAWFCSQRNRMSQNQRQIKRWQCAECFYYPSDFFRGPNYFQPLEGFGLFHSSCSLYEKAKVKRCLTDGFNECFCISLTFLKLKYLLLYQLICFEILRSHMLMSFFIVRPYMKHTECCCYLAE